jgi:hypothetical protein
MEKITTALVLAVGLLATSVPVVAQDRAVEVLQGQSDGTAASITPNEGGTGVTVVRGSSSFVPGKPAAVEPVAFIGGERIRIDNLEPTGSWFLERSEEGLTVVHCYTRQAVLVGGGRRILCDARRF